GALRPARADLREIVIEPAGESGIEVADVTLLIDREEPSGRVIEIVDRVLQFLKHVLLPVAVTCHVADGPRSPARVWSVLLQRAHAEAQPARRTAIGGRHPHLLL